MEAPIGILKIYIGSRYLFANACVNLNKYHRKGLFALDINLHSKFEIELFINNILLVLTYINLV